MDEDGFETPVLLKECVVVEVVDSTGTSESYVTVRIYKDADMTKPIAIGTSDIDGNFTQTLPSMASRLRCF